MTRPAPNVDWPATHQIITTAPINRLESVGGRFRIEWSDFIEFRIYMLVDCQWHYLGKSQSFERAAAICEKADSGEREVAK